MTPSPRKDHVRLVGLIPAGGESRRMGSNKLALPWKDSVVLDHVVRTVRPAVDRLVVVLGPRSKELMNRISREAEVVLLAEQTADMRQTIERGLGELSEEDEQATGVLVSLADQPHVPAEIIRQLVEAFRATPSRILYPVVLERKGHPVIVPISLLRELPRRPKGEGLDRLLRDHSFLIRTIDVSSASVLEDIDLPADYDRLRACD